MAQELQGLAQQKGVKAPEDAGVKHQALAKKLQVSKNFDQAYMAEMVKDHQKDIREVQKIAREAKDADLKAAARKAAPAMQAHLKLAQSITGGKSSAGR